ncbi:DUF475 domain-containing protein [Nocardioides zeae]|uniref:DUF475 domain-containing protein n=1 Tax=Nocardioides zeae TaxID=1457234 RepID=A0A6P0HJN7_9ACTN|nr:DUF475 domain-containing protein [Nocardioides zeae]
MILKTFGWSFAITVAGLAGAFLYGWKDGSSAALSAMTVAAILIVLEVSLSFDNAVVNAKVLSRMSPFWQKMFLTVGILIAVFGMRLVFPFIVVWASAGLDPVHAWDLAMQGNDVPAGQETYAHILHDAHPIIAAFGGMFLMMIFLDFFIDDEKEHHWLGPIERPFQRLSAVGGVSVAIALGSLVLVAELFRNIAPDKLPDDKFGSVLLAGILGLLTYLVVGGLGEAFEGSSGLADDEDMGPQREVGTGQVVLATGKAAFFMFLYLEVLDASFSFDGVIGAFAITTDPIVIAIGLGVGALYVRSITVYLVRKGTLSEYRYLEHGAHWAIGALAILLFVTMGVEIPEVVTGLIGVVIILSAVGWSVRENRLHPEQKHDVLV